MKNFDERNSGFHSWRSQTGGKVSTIIQTINDRRSCAEMLEDQERVKKMLRRAVRAEVASPALRAKIQKQIRAKHTFNFFSLTKGRAAIAACLLFAPGLSAWIVTASFERGGTANAIVSSELSPTLSEGTKRILNTGLGDHLHCAVDNRFTVEHLGFLFRDLETRHAGLRYLIAEKMGNAYKITRLLCFGYFGVKASHKLSICCA